jgi:hypothetical protein
MFSGLFALGGISKIVDIKSLILIVVTVGLLVGSYSMGYRAGQAESTNRENIRIIDTTRSISEGLNDFQRANPDRDAAVSLERLRLRQSQ